MIANFSASALAPQLEPAIAFGALVASWALLRPTMVRDYDNRRLPPSPTGRLLFAVLCVFAYAALTVCFFMFDQHISDFRPNIPVLDSLVGQFEGKAPLLAAITLAGLLQLSMFRDIERSLLAYLHSAGHLHRDGQILSVHLARCDFEPTESEQRQYREIAKRFGVHVTGDFDTVDFVTLSKWRKVATLARVLREWNPVDQAGALDDDEMKKLGEIETAHERKTQLSMTIVKLVEKAESGDPSGRALTDLMAALAKTRYADDVGVAEIEQRLREKLAASTSNPTQPLRLTGEEFRSYLSQIDGYFQAEYEILLHDVAQLAARSVVLSGDDAADRLETLRSLGFAGLGRIEAINVNRSLSIFMLVTVGGFLVLLLGMQRQADPPPAEVLARFAFVMAMSSLVAAYTVSRRSLLRSAQTPWASYFAAGMIAAAIQLTVNLIADLPKLLPQDGVPAADVLPIQSRLLWCALPFFLVLAICRLAQMERWPFFSNGGVAGALIERAFDAVAIGMTMLLSFYLVIGLHQALHAPLPPRLQGAVATYGFYGLVISPIALTLIALGALIGFFVVRDVRRAVHARIVEAAHRPEKAVVITQRKQIAAAA